MVLEISPVTVAPNGADIWKKAMFYDSSKNYFSLWIYILS